MPHLVPDSQKRLELGFLEKVYIGVAVPGTGLLPMRREPKRTGVLQTVEEHKKVMDRDRIEMIGKR